MTLNERLVIIEGIQLEYEVQGYLSTNDADYLIEAFQQLAKENKKIKNCLQEYHGILSDKYGEITKLQKENERLRSKNNKLIEKYGIKVVLD